VSLQTNLFIPPLLSRTFAYDVNWHSRLLTRYFIHSSNHFATISITKYKLQQTEIKYALLYYGNTSGQMLTYFSTGEILIRGVRFRDPVRTLSWEEFLILCIRKTQRNEENESLFSSLSLRDFMRIGRWEMIGVICEEWRREMIVMTLGLAEILGRLLMDTLVIVSSINVFRHLRNS